MHINVTIGLLGFLGSGIKALAGYLHATAAAHQPDQIAIAAQLTMSGLMLIYVLLCVRSFINARLSGKV
jgi:predicted acyltransferase